MMYYGNVKESLLNRTCTDWILIQLTCLEMVSNREATTHEELCN